MIELEMKKKVQEGGNATENKERHLVKRRRLGELMKEMHEEVVNKSSEWLVDIAKENLKNAPQEQL